MLKKKRKVSDNSGLAWLLKKFIPALIINYTTKNVISCSIFRIIKKAQSNLIIIIGSNIWGHSMNIIFHFLLPSKIKCN